MDGNFPQANSPEFRWPLSARIQKNIIPIGIISTVFILVLIGLFFFLRPTGPTNKLDTSDKSRGGEKTFQNKSFSYSLDYDSKDFRTGAQVKANDKSSYFQYCPLSQPEMCSEPINIAKVDILTNPRNLNLFDWIKADRQSPVYTQGKVLCYFNDSRTEINLNAKFKGENAITYKFILDEGTSKVCPDQEIEGSGIYKYTFVSKNGKIYWLSIRQTTEETFPILEKFLQGFKFN